MILYPVINIPTIDNNREAINKKSIHTEQTSQKAPFLTNQLATLALFGAALIGSTSLISCESNSIIDESEFTEITTKPNPNIKSLSSNIKNICNDLNIETGINKYGNKAACNKITHKDGSYDEIYSQLNTTKINPDRIYTNGIIIHRNIPKNSPNYDLNDSGVKYIQQITQNDEGNISILRKYDNDNMGIEQITIIPQDDGSYIYNKITSNGEKTIGKIYKDKNHTYIKDSIIEPYSKTTGGTIPTLISFDATI